MSIFNKQTIIEAIKSIHLPQEVLSKIIKKVNMLKPEDLEEIQLQYKNHVENWKKKKKKKETSKKTIKNLRSKMGGRRKTMKVQNGGELDFTIISSFLMVISVFIFIGFQSSINTCFQSTKVGVQNLIDNNTSFNDKSQWWENKNYTEHMKKIQEQIKRRKIEKRIKKQSISFPRLKPGDKLQYILESRGYESLLLDKKNKAFINYYNTNFEKKTGAEIKHEYKAFLNPFFEDTTDKSYAILWKSIMYDYFLDELIKKQEVRADKLLLSVFPNISIEDRSNILRLTDNNVNEAIDIMMKKGSNPPTENPTVQHIWTEDDLHKQAITAIKEWSDLNYHLDAYEHDDGSSFDENYSNAVLSIIEIVENHNKETKSADLEYSMSDIKDLNVNDDFDIINLNPTRNPKNLAIAFIKIHNDVVNIIKKDLNDLYGDIENAFRDETVYSPLSDDDANNYSPYSADVKVQPDGGIEITEKKNFLEGLSEKSAEQEKDSFKNTIAYAKAYQQTSELYGREKIEAINAFVDAESSWENPEKTEQKMDKNNRRRKRSKSLRRRGGNRSCLKKCKYTRRLQNKKKKIKRKKTVKK